MRIRRRGTTGAATLLVAALALAACSSGGGKQSTEGSGGGSGVANTPKFKVAMVTHAPAGDTFFDIIRKGAEAAAQKDNVQYVYSSSDEPSQQSLLVQNAVDQKVDAIAVSMPNTDSLRGSLKNAAAAGIPVVMFNAGFKDWQSVGALEYFGQDETLAGRSAGERLNTDGAKKVVCVLQAQGQSQLEARCQGVKDTFKGTMEKLYVTGTDMPSVQSTINAKLQQDPSIDHVITLGAPIALTAVQAIASTGKKTKLVTFDTNAELVKAVQAGSVEWAVDQQPYLQGYLAIDSLWLYKNNGDILGGGLPVLTGPAFVTKDNIASVAKYAARGTR